RRGAQERHRRDLSGLGREGRRLERHAKRRTPAFRKNPSCRKTAKWAVERWVGGVIFGAPDRLMLLPTAWDADQVVGGGHEDEGPLARGAPAVTGLAHHADSLHPAEGLLDALALGRADGVAGMARRARVDGRASIGIVLGNMGNASTCPAASD